MARLKPKPNNIVYSFYDVDQNGTSSPLPRIGAMYDHKGPMDFSGGAGGALSGGRPETDQGPTFATPSPNDPTSAAYHTATSANPNPNPNSPASPNFAEAYKQDTGGEVLSQEEALKRGTVYHPPGGWKTKGTSSYGDSSSNEALDILQGKSIAGGFDQTTKRTKADGVDFGQGKARRMTDADGNLIDKSGKVVNWKRKFNEERGAGEKLRKMTEAMGLKKDADTERAAGATAANKETINEQVAQTEGVSSSLQGKNMPDISHAVNAAKADESGLRSGDGIAGGKYMLTKLS